MVSSCSSLFPSHCNVFPYSFASSLHFSRIHQHQSPLWLMNATFPEVKIIHPIPSTIRHPYIHCIHATHRETRLIPLYRARCSSALSISGSPTRQAKKRVKITKVVAAMLPATKKGATGDTWGDWGSPWGWCENGC